MGEYVVDYQEAPYDPSMLPNEILSTALKFFDAARLVREHELEKDRADFLADLEQAWYVLHHLSVLSVELFMKSLIGTMVTQIAYEVGHSGEPYVAFYGEAKAVHQSFLSKLPAECLVDLQTRLSADQFTLLGSLKTKTLNDGRYPYEERASYIGQAEAEAWFQLAAQLREYRLSQVGRVDTGRLFI